MPARPQSPDGIISYSGRLGQINLHERRLEWLTMLAIHVNCSSAYCEREPCSNESKKGIAKRRPRSALGKPGTHVLVDFHQPIDKTRSRLMALAPLAAMGFRKRRLKYSVRLGTNLGEIGQHCPK